MRSTKKQYRRLLLESLTPRQLLAANILGDFDNDGYDDLVVGDRTAVVAGQSYAGAVQVTYGSRGGLNANRSQTLTQKSFTTAESGDNFGKSFAVGDFNNDGFDDLAVGSPNEDIGNIRDAGLVSVFYGSKQGLKTTGVRLLQQNSSGIQGTAEAGDQFGLSLAAGDFDNDGHDDLAIGAPYDSVSGNSNAGLVHVIYGSSGGLQSRDAVFSQDTSGVLGVAEKSDYFGLSLATGDFNRDGRDDLAIGVPGEDVGTIINAGAVQVLYGSKGGLTTEGDAYYHQDTSGIEGKAEVGDQFGYDLATGDFNGDGSDDLAIGAPYENIGTIRDAGAVSVIYGSTRGLQSNNQIFYQGYNGTAGTAEAYDRYGFSLAVGDVNGDKLDDLAVGVPYESHSNRVDAGAVNVIYGSKSGLSKVDTILSQGLDSIQGAAEENDRFAHDVYFGDFNNDGKSDLVAVVEGENFGSYDAPDTTNVIYGQLGSLSSARNEMWVPARQTKNGFSLSSDNGEDEPVDIPVEVSGSWLTDEDERADIPVEVSGSFLVDFDPLAWAQLRSGDAEAYSYNDINQQESSSCIFSASLAAVARTGFNFSDHIRYAGSNGAGYLYEVKLYDHQTLKAQWVKVSYDGTRTTEDMGYADKGEFWTVLYLRAYAKKYDFKLSELNEAKNAQYRNTRTAMQTITGKTSDWDSLSTSQAAQQNKVAVAIKAGKAVMAVTIKGPAGKKDILTKGGIGKTGLIYGHGYTVLGVENAGKSSATVTLFNPWGKDNNLAAKDYNDGFKSGSLFEGKTVDGETQDGIIRLSWNDFRNYFSGYNVSPV
jgi:hypothetical protein